MVENDDYRAHLEYDNPDGTRHYEGALGQFDYDPDQFELTTIRTNGMNGIPGGEYESLRYIGTETDGNKIKIPDGIVDAHMMFSGTGITSMPVIPDSVLSADCMFSGCTSLKTVSRDLGKNVKDANFMFGGCVNLEQGPVVVPGNIKNANYMFMMCSNMKNTPVLEKGIQTGECMFSGCKSLKTAPNVPKTMQEYFGMTSGCSGLDAASILKNEEKMMKSRKQFEKQLNRKSLTQHIGSGLSAVMQCHMLRQSGYGMIMAPIMTHVFRKNGQLGNTLSSAMAMNAMRRGGVSSVIMYGFANHAEKKAAKREASNQAKMEAWDRISKATGGNVNSRSMKFATMAEKDTKRGLFTQIHDLSYTEKLPFYEIYGAQQGLKENILAKAYENRSYLSPTEKHTLAEYYQSEVASCAAYYAEAKVAIAEQYKNNPKQRMKALKGLDQVSSMQLSPLVSSIERLQDRYQIFNDGDLYNISKMVEKMPSEQFQAVKFMDRVMSPTVQESRFASKYSEFMERHNVSEEAVNRRREAAQEQAASSKSSPKDRFRQAASRFGNFVKDSFNMQDDKQDVGPDV